LATACVHAYFDEIIRIVYRDIIDFAERPVFDRHKAYAIIFCEYEPSAGCGGGSAASSVPASIQWFQPRIVSIADGVAGSTPDAMRLLLTAVTYAGQFYSRFTGISSWEGSLHSLFSKLSLESNQGVLSASDVLRLLNRHLHSVPAVLSRVLDAHPEAVDDPDDYHRLVSNAVSKALSYDSALVDQLCTNKLKRAYYDQQQQLSLLQEIQINDKRPRFADGCAADSVTHATLVASAVHDD
jgi:hypothetical protein